MGIISGWGFTCHTGWVGDCCWRRIFGWIITGLTLGYPLGYPNTEVVLGSLFGSLTGMILLMSIVNPLVSLFEYICYINWCGTWLGSWKLL